MDETLGIMSEYSRSFHGHKSVTPKVYQREQNDILPNDYDHFHLDKTRTIEFTDEPKWRSATKAYEEAIRQIDDQEDDQQDQVIVRKSTTLDNKRPYRGERIIQRYPNKIQRPKSGFTLMKTTGTCMTNRDEPDEDEVF